jgi:hypothetical protein
MSTITPVLTIPSNNQNVDALIGTHRWASNSLSFYFSTTASDYLYSLVGVIKDEIVISFNQQWKNAANNAFKQLESFSGLAFAEGTSAVGSTILLAQFRPPLVSLGTTDLGLTASGGFPEAGPRAGNVWFNADYSGFSAPAIGSYTFH